MIVKIEDYVTGELTKKYPDVANFQYVFKLPKPYVDKLNNYFSLSKRKKENVRVSTRITLNFGTYKFKQILVGSGYNYILLFKINKPIMDEDEWEHELRFVIKGYTKVKPEFEFIYKGRFMQTFILTNRQDIKNMVNGYITELIEKLLRK